MSDESRTEAKHKLSIINSKGFLVRIKNRCILTGKARGIIRKFTISQTSLRILARSGAITGIKKGSWLFKFLIFTL